jgi:hypothetical protein
VESAGLTYAPRYDRRHHVNVLAQVRPFERVELSARWELGSGFPFSETAGYYDRLTLGNIFNGPFVSETGVPYAILGPKNAARLPAYHRLDLSAGYTLVIPLGEHSLRATTGLQLINVYDRSNILYFDRSTGQKFTMLPFFPSASLTLEYSR